MTTDRSRFESWLDALDQRHLANLRPSEVTRALRALSSCYVERREKLASGGPLDSAGKRAAFALFYAPLHFMIAERIVTGLNAAASIKRLLDLGCGTGSAGAAFAIAAGAARVDGIDRNGWAAGEANWTYRTLGLEGRATPGTIQKATIPNGPGAAVLAAYAVNELSDEDRGPLLQRFLDAHSRGTRVLIIEPIARRPNRWWPAWKDAFSQAGGREEEWRFRVVLPDRQRTLAKAAGLDPQELTARSLFLP